MNATQIRASRFGRGRDEGWTLIELLVVVTLILLLASMTLVQYRNSITRAKEATLKSDLLIMRDAIDQYYADKGRYPESLQTLVSEQYLRDIPRDPFTESKEVVAGYTIIDVKSREEALAWTKRYPNPAPNGEAGEIEVRPVYQLEDFGDIPAVREMIKRQEGGK